MDFIEKQALMNIKHSDTKQNTLKVYCMLKNPLDA